MTDESRCAAFKPRPMSIYYTKEVPPGISNKTPSHAVPILPPHLKIRREREQQEREKCEKA